MARNHSDVLPSLESVPLNRLAERYGAEALKLAPRDRGEEIKRMVMEADEADFNTMRQACNHLRSIGKLVYDLKGQVNLLRWFLMRPEFEDKLPERFDPCMLGDATLRLCRAADDIDWLCRQDDGTIQTVNWEGQR